MGETKGGMMFPDVEIECDDGEYRSIPDFLKLQVNKAIVDRLEIFESASRNTADRLKRLERGFELVATRRDLLTGEHARVLAELVDAVNYIIRGDIETAKQKHEHARTILLSSLGINQKGE